MALPGEYLAVFDGTRWVSVRGDKGDPGTSLTVKGTKPTVADLPTTATVGEAWIVAGAMHQWDGTAWNNLGNVQGPAGAPGAPGPKGDPGAKGDRGTDGANATVRVGSVTSGATPAVTNTGTNSAAVLNFVLAKGDAGPAGPKGDPGDDATITVAATNTLPTGSPATVTSTVTGPGAVSLSFGLPTGPAGAAGTAGAPGVAGTAGKDGTAATITLGTVTTLAAGQPATAKNTGTSSAAVIELSIPQGSQGLQGPAGPAGTAGKDGAAGAAGAKGDKGDTGAAGKDGSGVTISGTQNGGTWPPTGTHTKGDMILLGTPLPTGVPAGSLTGQGMVYDGAAWQNVGSIQGPAGVAGAKGDAGPSAVSTDAGNYSKLGTDKLIFTPTPTIPAAGTANPLTDGTSAPGVSLKYAREDHVHPLPTLTALGAAATKHTHAAATDVTGLSTVATSGKYADLTDGYTLPEASATVLGGVKVGTGLTITAGVLSASGTTATDATTAKAGLVTLADAAAITAGTVGRIPDASQLKGQIDARAMRVNPAFTGVVQIPAGTAAAPSLAFTGDTDTGVFAPSANSVGLSAGGVSALEVTATGTTVAGTLTAGGLKYPATPGTKDQVLASDGAGNVAWTTVAAGTTYTLPAATPLALGGVKVADAAAVTLGAAGYVVDAAQLKASADLHVLKAGDTMTGRLIVHPANGAAPLGGLLVVGEDVGAAVDVNRFSNAAAGPRMRFTKGRGTVAAPAVVAANDSCGEFVWQGTLTDGTAGTAGTLSIRATAAPVAGDKTVHGKMVFTVGNGTATTAAPLTLTAAGVTVAGDVDVSGTVTTANVTATGIATIWNLEVGNTATLKGVVIHTATAGIAHTISLTSPNAASQADGLVVNVMPVASATSCGVRVSNQGKGTGTNIGMEIEGLPAGPQNYSFFDNSPAQNYFKGHVGINWTTPTANLEVNGTTKLRGTLECTGNITSAGTAHSFAAKSIPASAIDGGLSIPHKTPASQTAPGTAGEFAWDANYLYGCIAANQWRRLPWLDWSGAGAPGAGVTDPSLGSTFHNANGPYLPLTGMYTGMVLVGVGDMFPPSATGVKIQYRTVSGAWQDFTSPIYLTGEVTTNNFNDFKMGLHGISQMALIGGLAAGTAYIIRMAWVSAVGTGPWTSEYPAITPTKN